MHEPSRLEEVVVVVVVVVVMAPAPACSACLHD
jgi:hypothetical protein